MNFWLYLSYLICLIGFLAINSYLVIISYESVPLVLEIPDFHDPTEGVELSPDCVLVCVDQTSAVNRAIGVRSPEK